MNKINNIHKRYNCSVRFFPSEEPPVKPLTRPVQPLTFKYFTVDSIEMSVMFSQLLKFKYSQVPKKRYQ